MIISVVGKNNYDYYQNLIKGYYLRTHGFESLACEVAGIKLKKEDKFKFN